MGCGSSSHPSKRETRAHSQVTVAAQQRAEAAYRRQRMAQEREQTAVQRAELEVERARMLKEMSGGSRRPSYCIELEELKEEPPDEVRENQDEYPSYSVEARNAKNSLSNEYPNSTVITKSESRGEKDEQQNSQEGAGENDENANTERRNNSGDNNEQEAREKNDLLQAVNDRSAQASPSSVRIEENEQTRDHSGNDHETLDVNAAVVDGSETLKKDEDVSITDNADASLDQTVEKPMNNSNDVTTIVNEDLSTTHEHPTTKDENLEIKTENNSEGIEQSQADTTNNVNSNGGDTEPDKVADDLNAESSLHKKEEVEQNEQQQQQQQQHQQTTEHSENIDNGSDQTKTSQDLESLERRHEDANVAQSNEEQDLTSEKEN